VDVIDTLAELFLARGAPTHIRSDQGPEFMAEAVKAWLAGVGARTAYIEKASPWKNGYVESFNGKMRDELVNGEVFNTLREAQVLIEGWRRHYNRVRPHSALGYRPQPRRLRHWPGRRSAQGQERLRRRTKFPPGSLDGGWSARRGARLACVRGAARRRRPRRSSPASLRWLPPARRPS
jgi:transposase InsO family protein